MKFKDSSGRELVKSDGITLTVPDASYIRLSTHQQPRGPSSVGIAVNQPVPGATTVRFKTAYMGWTEWQPYSDNAVHYVIGESSSHRIGYIEFKDISGNVVTVQKSF
ncbi:MAG: hypothetical protein GY754_25030 [bacterium]|nr:hypothetical protein [bacterium]